ncbi:MAG: hypothetical protein J6T10_19200 [Methanobrevibacter sp.]|nr:hypothetical protein [Methanobrevibacter sp.]
MAKKIKKYKVGLDSETYKISMVSEPAIEVDYVALAKQDEEVDVKLSSDERHICYGPALIPNKDIYRNNGEQEFYINFTEDSITKMSQEFMKDYRQHEINLQHEENVDEVYVCESWLVEDPYKDKANALGFNVPKNTWMVGLKVNNIDTWERVKSGELRGFSVESAIRLEEFNNQEKNNETMEVENETFWTRMRDVIKEAFTLASKDKEAEEELMASEEKFEEEKPTETPVEEPKVEEPTEVKEEPKEEPVEPKNEPKEEPKKEDNHLEELINNLKSEIEALKEVNSGLQAKIKDLGKTPSTKPVSTNAKPNPKDTYAAWREQMRAYIS